MTPAARRFGAACAAGAALALVAFVWILVTRPGGFFGRTPFGLGAFYDAQARALFHGHWDAGPTAFSLERFHIGGRYYMYFGPWPSLLRSPVLLVTDALDGRLTSTSLVLAAVTLFAGTGRLLWIVRGLFDRGDPSRRELVAIGGLVFLIGCGSSVIFLSGSAWVYDEAILWGAAWAVWGLAATMDYLRGRSRAALVLATVFTTLAALSRTTSGAVGIVLLGSLLLVRVSQVPRGPRLRAAASWIARVTGLDHRLDGRPVWSLGLAVFTPVVAYAAVNFARFGSMYAVPWNKQDILSQVPARRHVLAVNGPDVISWREVPTNLVQYLRPDRLALHHAFPYVGFGGPPLNIGGVARDPRSPTSSLLSTTTLLVLVAVVGMLVVFVPPIARRVRSGRARELRLPVVATAAAFLPTLVLAVVHERYMADLTPLFAVTGIVGLYALAAVVRERPGWRRAGTVIIVVLLIVNVWTNVALTIEFRNHNQQLLAPHG